MSYIATGLFTKDSRQALEVSPDELRALDTQTRAEFLLREEEIRTQKRQAFWDAVTAAITVVAFFGLGKALGGKK